MDEYNYRLENRLKELSPDLHNRAMGMVVVLQKTLESFATWFPDFTDHSLLHSMDVLDFANQLLRDQVEELNSEECYVLLMSCYLHDIGMGITRKGFETFTKEVNLAQYRAKNPEASIPDIIRDHHNEFSGLFIKRYAEMLDIPSEELTFAIIQVCRGHRKTDLYDRTEYPDLKTSQGVIRTAYLAAVVRLADEIDVGADRNPEILFDTSKLTRQRDIDAFGTHESIRYVEVTEKSIILRVKPKEPRYEKLIEELAGKIQKTLDYCRDVALKCSDLRITQERVEVVKVE